MPWTLTDFKKIHRNRTVAEKEAQAQQFVALTVTAWFCLTPSNKARVLVGKLLQHPAFEWGMISLTVISSVFLALDSPNMDNATLDRVVFVTDVIFAVLFSSEMAIKDVRAWRSLFILVPTFARFGM